MNLSIKKYLLFFLFSISIAFLFYFCTINISLSISPDSVTYLEVSQNLATKGKLFDNSGNFISHWPPLYPVSITLFSKIFNLNAIDSAKILNLFLVACFFFLMNIYLLSRKFNLKAILFCNIIILSSFFFQIFSMVWSEPLFIVILFCITLTLDYQTRITGPLPIIILGLLSALLFLTRYAGASIIFAVYLIIFINRKNKIDKIKALLIYTISLLPIISLWIILTKLNTHEIVDRNFSFNLISKDTLISFIKTIVYWIFPWITIHKFQIFQYFIYIIFSILLLFHLFKIAKSVRSLNVFNINKNLFIFIFIYFNFILFSITFIDHGTPLDNRILSPIFPFVIILLIEIALLLNKKKQFSRFFIYLIFTLLFSQFLFSFSFWKKFSINGDGYSSSASKLIWLSSETLNSDKIPENFKIFTNAKDIINYYYPNFSSRTFNLFIKTNTYSEIDKIFYTNLKKNNFTIIYLYGLNRNFYIEKEKLFTLFKENQIFFYKDGFVLVNIGK
jgi:hypothetical protein